MCAPREAADEGCENHRRRGDQGRGVAPVHRRLAPLRARFHERHLAFESWDALARVQTGERMEPPATSRREVASIRALTKALGRDYSKVCTRMGRR
jgi:hypothetical protein